MSRQEQDAERPIGKGHNMTGIVSIIAMTFVMALMAACAFAGKEA
ncbi:MAG: hypothetical protein ACOYJL_08275 [Tractidigestivibacter sp.]